MQNFLISGWQEMDQLVTRAMSLPGSWGHMDMLRQNIYRQVNYYFFVNFYKV